MEHEGSLPHSQKPDPCPYSLPKQPIPYFPYPISKKIHSNIILPSTSGSFKQSMELT